MPARNRNFGEFHGVQIIGTEVKNTICAWELWHDRQHVGYAYTQPALQDPNASTGWVFRELGNGTRSGTPYQARTWEQAVVEFRRALAEEGAVPEGSSWVAAAEEEAGESTDTRESGMAGGVTAPTGLADGLGRAANVPRNGKNLLVGIAVGACLGALFTRRAKSLR